MIEKVMSQRYFKHCDDFEKKINLVTRWLKLVFYYVCVCKIMRKGFDDI